MKVILTCLFALTLFVCVSCKKSGSNVPQPQSPSKQDIVGTWNIVKDSTVYTVKGLNKSSEYATVQGYHFAFTSDGKFYEKEGSFTDTATYAIVEDLLNIIHKPKNGVITGQYFDTYFFIELQPLRLKLGREFAAQGDTVKNEYYTLDR